MLRVFAEGAFSLQIAEHLGPQVGVCRSPFLVDADRHLAGIFRVYLCKTGYIEVSFPFPGHLKRTKSQQTI